MRPLLAIFRREFTLYFVSPIGYIVLIVFLLVTGFNFSAGLVQFAAFARSSNQALAEGTPVNVNLQLLNPLFFNMAFTVLFVVPLLTMRLFSDERRQGSLELLLTYPVSDFQVVLGKYLAALALYTLMLVSTLWSVVALFSLGNPDPGPVVSGYLGLLLYGAALIALGMMLSALTENQIVAGVLTFFIYLVLWLLNGVATTLPRATAAVVNFISVTDHFQALSQGVIDSADLIYFASLIAFGLYLSLTIVAAQRWSGD